MNKTIISIVIIAILFLVMAIPKVLVANKLKKLFNSAQFEEYQKFLNTKLVKFYVKPVDVEMNRLIGYMAAVDDKNTAKQLDFMFNDIKMFEKQKLTLAQRAFYFYLKQEDFKKCKKMLNILSEAKVKPSDYDTMLIITDIFGDNKFNHIDELKEKIEVLNQKSVRDKQVKLNTGIYEYMIAYQYMNKKDYKKQKEYLNKALSKCKDTPYENKINDMLKKLKDE